MSYYMKIYLAAAYERKKEMRAVRDGIEKIEGMEVISSWIDEGDHLDCLSGLIDKPKSQTYIETNIIRAIAERDVKEVISADLLILFAGGDRGGRHYECALHFPRPVYVIGGPETIFHYLDNVTWFDTIEQCLLFIENWR
jgi:hypothetical protein